MKRLANARALGGGRLVSLPALFFALIIMAIASSPSAARVIGVVFDDSGSMRGRIHTPTFGVQLLVSTLDGRSGADRLLTLRLSEVEGLRQNVPGANVTRATIAIILGELRRRGFADQPIAPEKLQSTVNRIRKEFAHAEGGTPYLAIELMLAALTDALKPGEEGYLIVVTDGKFKPDPPKKDDLRKAFEDYKSALAAKAARLTVDFLAIGLFEDDAFFNSVDGQCVRPLLLAVFNADESAAPVETCQEPHIKKLTGYHNVTTVDELVRELEGIVAAISGTARNLGARFVRIDGPNVTVDSPLSVSRIVTIATGTDKLGPPKVKGNPFPGAVGTPVESSMEKEDKAAPKTKKAGFTTQYVFAPRPLPAGAHSLTFDRDLGSSLQLVFQTAARVELEVMMPAGTPAPRDAQDRVLIIAGVPYRIVATIVDDTPQGRRVVPLASLRGPVAFSSILEVGPKRRPVAMARDGPADRAIGDFVEPGPGEIVASADAAIKDFLTLSSPALRIKAIDGRIRFETALRGLEACPDCPSGTALATFDTTQRARDVAEVTVLPQGELAGLATLDRSGLPAWLTIMDAAGRPLTDGAQIEIAPQQPIRLMLGRDARSCAGVNAATEPFAIALKAAAPLSGEAKVAGVIRVAVSPARLTFSKPRGVTDNEGRLVSTAFSLARAEGDLEFRLEGFCAPPKREEIAATAKTWFVGLTVATEPNETVTANPTIARWCACLAFFDRGAHAARLVYRAPGALQTASAEAPFVVAPTWMEGLACLLTFLVLIWFAGAVIVAYSAERFPRGSVVEIQEGKQLPRYVDLRGLNWTFLKSAFWPFRRLLFGVTPPHERRGVEGLRLVARRGGLIAEVDRETTDFELRGQQLSEILETNPKLTNFRINWREEAEIPGNPKITLRFLRSIADASQA